MQTRKRAKSVSFGKKAKDKREKEAVKETQEEKEPQTAYEEKEKKAEETTLSSDLSTTPPETDAGLEAKTDEVATPADEFITDSSLSSTPELPKETTPESDQAGKKEDKTINTSVPESVPVVSTESPAANETPQPVETLPVPAAAEPAQPAEAQGLSSTPPQSAFTIQGNETPVPEVTTEGKKRFGLYFIIIAILAFVLGLGAITAANYFGLIKLSIPHMGIPFIGAKPTPTLVPTTAPTAMPTEAQVNLSAYTISVLNGSTVAGKAADTKASLTADGYKVTTVGNADNSNYTKTEIAAKSTVDKAFISRLQQDAGKLFVLDPTVGTLPASSSTDVTVTLGSQTAQ
jgi:LytR cell envelope-related transcriptional attenuator